MSNGVVYLNAGTKCLPRLLVSVYSLRKNYSGEISIVSIGEESHEICKKICDMFVCQLIEVKQEHNFKHYYWYEKARINSYSKYDNTIFIDSDTLILKPFDELFTEIEKNDFIVPQFSDWSVKKGIIQKRLSAWKQVDEDLFNKTITSGMSSVNVGVFGFNKKSDLMNNWFNFTIKKKDAVLPEESTCHLLLNRYKGKIIDSKYNYSCKHEKKPVGDSVIIHYHGRKHCRVDENKIPIFNSDLWIENWSLCLNNNICDVNKWWMGCGDTQLRRFMNVR